MASSRTLLLSFIAVLATAGSATAQQVVGAVGAANAAPTARAPGHAARTLKPGSDIFFRDHIVTKRGGSAQLTFLDRSTLNVSENSDLVIDEFVYKPGASGTMSASLSRGMVRFVGGEISHGGGATIQTPAVTIGIRGGIATVGFVRDGAALAAIPGVPSTFHGGTIIINGFGALSVRNGAGTVEITRPGFAVFVGGANEAIAAPTRLDMAAAQALMKSLTSANGQHGGASSKAVTAAHPAPGAAPAAVHLAEVKVAVPQPPSVDALNFTSTFAIGNALVRNRSQDQLAQRLNQILTSPAVAAATAGGTVAGTVVNADGTKVTVTIPAGAPAASAPAGGTNGTPPHAGLPSNGTTLTVNDLNVASVTAQVIYAHTIDSGNIHGTIIYGTNYGTTSGVTISGVGVIANQIYAHDIHAGSVYANTIYVDSIND